MNSILQSLARRVDGLQLFESFESPNFIVDQDWTVLNGTPSISSAVSKEGIYSLIMDSTYPQIQKKFSVPFGYSSVWFYDDATQTAAGFNPQVTWTDSINGQAFTVGVNNSVDPTVYCYAQPLGSGPTSTPRTTGWHRFTVYLLTDLNVIVVMIDNVVFLRTTYTGILDTITLGAGTYTGTPFGYFDWVQVLVDPFITVYGLTHGQYLNVVLNSAGAIIQTNHPVDAGIAQVDVSTVDFPAQGFLQVQQPPYGDGLFYQSDILTLYGGDRYLLNLYRFDRKPTAIPLIQPQQMRNDLKSVGGAKQSVFFYDQDQVTLTWRAITEAQKNELLRWWTTAKRGETFSVAIDEAQIYLDYTQFPVVGWPTGQLMLSSPATQAGQVLTVQSSDGTIKENVKVASVSLDNNSGIYTANLDLPQTEAVAAGLQVRALYYWPFCTTMAKNLAVVPEDIRSKRWTVSITFEELIQTKSWISFLLNQ